LYSNLRALLDATAKDPAIEKVQVETASETEREVIKLFFEWKHNGKAPGNGWNRSGEAKDGEKKAKDGW